MKSFSKHASSSSSTLIVQPPRSLSRNLSTLSFRNSIQSGNMSEFVEIDPSGRYGRLGKVLGRGAMKTVYQAFDEALGMEVAWNQVVLHDIFQSPDELQRLYTEVHLLKNLKHDAIVQFYTSWIDYDHRTFNFITEMFTSGTLRDYRKRYKQVDMRAIKNWARQILRGLLYLHSHDPPVIHRDLKCDNILVNGHLGIVKIGDLGLAAILRSSQHAHSVIGTPEFMAPELYEEEYNELVDVYSFGMCMLEMLTLELPYSECSNTAQIYKKVTAGKKPNAFYRIQDLEAQSFVEKCLQVASKRLSAHELLLDPFLASEELFLASEPPLQMFFPKAKRHLAPVEPIRSNDMTITGKVNPEDNTIDLKVQIADSNGHARNILFPFDIENDTAMNVAIEMVKELDISDRDPFEIAEMIEEEISALVPDWKDRNLRRFHLTPRRINLQRFFHEDGEGYDDANNSGKCTFSSISFLSGDSAGSPSWLPSDSPSREDRRLWGSYGFSNCFDFDCTRVNENQSDSDHERGERTSPTENLRLMRFCPTGKAMQNVYSQEPKCQCDKMDEYQSFKDVRSQHLHQALRQSMDRHKLKTVGAVENIGFRVPCAVSEQCASSKSIS